MSPPMSNDQPQWAKDEATNLAIAYVDWLGRDTVDADAEQVLAQSVSQALLSAYERGRTERERELFESFEAHYQGWVSNPDEHGWGTIALGNAMWFAFPNLHGEMDKRRANATTLVEKTDD